MIDCSSTEIAAIRTSFGDAIQILLYHWHIQRAWETHIKKRSNTQESKMKRQIARSLLNSMMYAKDQESFNLQYETLKHCLTEFLVFLAYIESRWIVKKELWVKVYRLDAEFHMNNMIESYHNKLKTFYLGQSRNYCVDRIVYMLSKVVTMDYRREEAQVLFGINSAHLSKFELERKRIADDVDIDRANAMVVEIDETTFRCSSFSNLQVSYVLAVEDRCVVSCTCPVVSSQICKHMFLVCCVKKLAFTKCLFAVSGCDDTNIDVLENQVDLDVKVNDTSFPNTSDITLVAKEAIDCTANLLIRKINEFRSTNHMDIVLMKSKKSIFD